MFSFNEKGLCEVCSAHFVTEDDWINRIADRLLRYTSASPAPSGCNFSWHTTENRRGVSADGRQLGIQIGIVHLYCPRWANRCTRPALLMSRISTCASLPAHQVAQAQTTTLTCVLLPTRYFTLWPLLWAAQMTAAACSCSATWQMCSPTVSAHRARKQVATHQMLSSAQSQCMQLRVYIHTWVVTAFLHIDLVLSLQQNRYRRRSR